jgi:LmbE family N-acetylglucosaminyl deacetylase
MANKRVLAVWAHPDDESFGPVGTTRLAHEQGWATAVITATRGDAGQNAGALADGETIGDLRERELRCAAEHIGIDHLHVWQHPDGGLADLPAHTLRNEVLAVMREWQPQVVITFGPDGITGHSDHIAISTATTDAFHQLRRELGANGPQRLFYVTVPPDQRIKHRMGDAPPPGPAHAVIDVHAYVDVQLAALRCHASQRPDWEPMVQDRDWLLKDRFTCAYPPVDADATVQTTIFDA